MTEHAEIMEHIEIVESNTLSDGLMVFPCAARFSYCFLPHFCPFFRLFRYFRLFRTLALIPRDRFM